MKVNTICRNIYRVNQTTSANQCVATLRSLVEVQNQLQLTTNNLPTTNSRKLFSTLWNTPKWHLGGGGRLWIICICKGKWRNISFKRSLYPRHYGENSFQLFSSIEIWLKLFFFNCNPSILLPRLKKVFKSQNPF